MLKENVAKGKFHGDPKLYVDKINEIVFVPSLLLIQNYHAMLDVYYFEELSKKKTVYRDAVPVDIIQSKSVTCVQLAVRYGPQCSVFS